jgi:hypothetical protein
VGQTWAASAASQVHGGVFLWSFLLEAVDSALIAMASTVSATGNALFSYFEAAFFCGADAQIFSNGRCESLYWNLLFF